VFHHIKWSSKEEGNFSGKTTPKPSQNDPLQSLPSEHTFNEVSLNKLPPSPSPPTKVQTPHFSPPPELKFHPLGKLDVLSVKDLDT